MKWPWRRRAANQKSMPEEVKDYYRVERRDRMWLVWLLSLITFFGTVAVVLLLFWGGRWAYNQIWGDDTPQAGNQATPSSASDAQDQQTARRAAEGSSDGNANDQNSGSAGSQSSQGGASQGTTTQTYDGTQTGTTPNTGPSQPETLVNTGPDGDY